MGAAHKSRAHCSFLPLAQCVWLQSNLLINGCAQSHCLAAEISVRPNPAACGVSPKENSTSIDKILYMPPGGLIFFLTSTEIKSRRWENPTVP